MNNVLRRRRHREVLSGYLYLSPAAVIFLVFTIGPALFVLYISFWNWDYFNAAASTFAGFANYATLFTTPLYPFWNSLIVTLYFVVGSVPTGLFLALLIALFLMESMPGRALVRLAVFSPYVTPVVATSIIWIWMLNPQYGLFNTVLHGLHLPELGWLESSTWAMPGVLLYTLWHSLGFDVIIFLAGLSGVSGELREAARIDGASRWQEFWRVTWPLLTPTTLFVLVISTIASMQAFTQFFVMTDGGPGTATTTTSLLLYDLAFEFFHTGLGAALAVLLFVIIAGLTVVQWAVTQRRTFYQ